jgi:hypothetical protein
VLTINASELFCIVCVSLCKAVHADRVSLRSPPQLSISGYNHKLPVLLDAILDKVVELEVCGLAPAGISCDSSSFNTTQWSFKNGSATP